MARITCEDCLSQIGDGNRFNLIHLAVKRVKQHRQGAPFLIEGKNKEIVMTLREVAAGKVTFANIQDLPDVMESNDDQLGNDDALSGEQ
jgi:DNA-directed RNA polymerase subunit omega